MNYLCTNGSLDIGAVIVINIIFIIIIILIIIIIIIIIVFIIFFIFIISVIIQRTAAEIPDCGLLVSYVYEKPTLSQEIEEFEDYVCSDKVNT